LKRIRLLLGILLLLMLVIVGLAVTAANQVPVTGLGEASIGISGNQLKPPECAGINITNVITGSGKIDGTRENDLILGSSANDTIKGEGGNDCILGGAGDDTLSGGPGNDILMGGAGNDTLSGGPGNDILMGGAGFDICEMLGDDQSYDCEG
jgi:Ca2+-binding RTX toxin-like protein